jgi:hypothetical protein
MTMKKIILLSTAAVLLSPIAAKANQKSSIFVGAFGTVERLAIQHGEAAASDYLKDESFWTGGIEAGYGYKAWKNLQVTGLLRAGYSPEHTYADTKKVGDALRKDPGAVIVEPRVTVGWEFPVSGNVTITPFIGTGLEMNFSKKDGKKVSTDLKMPLVGGARFGFGTVYVSLNGRFDLTSAAIDKKTEALNREADAVRFLGGELSVGAEF